MGRHQLFYCFLAMSVSHLVAGNSCTYSTSFGTTLADCSARVLESVPTSLSLDIQILHATHNRIRDLYNDSLKQYTQLKFLYLDDNMISYIQNGTFNMLQDLQILGLSHNLLNKIPVGVLQLPKLRKLFLDDNHLTGGGGFAGAPTSGSLEILSLANCHLEDLPLLSIFPNLKELNVSGNEMKSISPLQLAPMCRLNLLDLRRNPELFKDSEFCVCHLLAVWIKQMSIYLAEVPLNCSSDSDSHTDSGFPCESQPKEVIATQHACMTTSVTKEHKTNVWLTWILPSVLVMACLFIIILLIGTKHVCISSFF